jgi:hypothetical protein
VSVAPVEAVLGHERDATEHLTRAGREDGPEALAGPDCGVQPVGDLDDLVRVGAPSPLPLTVEMTA